MMGQRLGGRAAGTPNKATAEVRALASAYGPDAVDQLAVLAGVARDDAGGLITIGVAQTDAGRIAALGHLLDRGYGKSPLSVPIRIDLPDASTPAGLVTAMARIIGAV